MALGTDDHVPIDDAAAAVENDRVAAEIHDGVVKRIYSAALLLHTVLQTDLPESSAARLRTAVDELDTALAALRSTSFSTVSRETRS